MTRSRTSAIDHAGRWLLFGLLVIYTLYNLGPIFWLVLSSLKSRMDLFSMPPKLFFTPDFSGYQSVFGVGAAAGSASAVGVFDSLVNSVVVSVTGTALAVVLGTLAGYVCSRFNFLGKGDFMFFVLSTRMLPPVAVLVFYHLMFARLGLADTRTGLILVAIFANVGLATWIMKGFFDGVPKEVEQIAIVNGYTRMYAFTKLVLPMVKGGIAATAGFCFIFAWNEFAFASILTTTQAKTLPVKISAAAGATGIEWTQICAAGVVLIVPVLVFFYLVRKHLLMGMTFGVLGEALTMTASAATASHETRQAELKKRSSGRLMIFGFLSPTLAILLFMVAYPFFSLVYYSFFNFPALRPAAGMKPVGFKNYSFLLSDPELWDRFVFTGKFVFLCVALQMLIGIFVGYQLQKNFRGRDLVFTLLMMPMMLSPVVVGFLWRYMFNSEWGVINFLLTTVGLEKIDWLGQTNAALWAAVIADTWMWAPFIILLATAAFRGIPETIYESAEVDGASAAYTFFRITLPMSAPVLFIALILRLIDSFKQYDLFFALTGGGPGSSTMTVSFAVAKTAFSYFYTGEASALAVILLVIIIGLSMILVRHLGKMGEKY